MAKLNLKELQNLSRLLLSDDTTNVELGLGLLHNNKEYVLVFSRELTLLYYFQDSLEIKETARVFLEEAQGAKKLFSFNNNFKIFSYLRYHYTYTPEVRKMFVDHENVLAQFYDMIIENRYYTLKYYDLAYKLHIHYNEQLEWAEKYYRMVLHSNPDHEKSLFYLAFLLNENTEYTEEALQLYLRVLAINPSESAACNNVGLIYDEWQQRDKAYEYFHMALTNHPDNKAYLRNLARTCVKMDDIERKEEGKKILQELTEKHPKDGLIWNSWADYLWNVEHNYKATEEAYLQGLKVAPKNSYLLGNLGELYIDIYNRLDEGFMLYEEALAQQQSIYRLTTVVTAFVHKAQDWKKAKKYYQMLLKNSPLPPSNEILT